MRASFVPVVAALLVLPAIASGESVAERNLAFFSSFFEGEAPRTPVETTDGRTLALDDAILELAERAGPVDLAALTAGAAPDALGVHMGDLWIMESGLGPCTADVLAPGSPMFVPLDPQLIVYAGSTSTLSTTHGFYTTIVSWTGKTSETRFNTAGFTAIGAQDFYCFNYSGQHFAFPFVNGLAWFNGATP